MGRKSRKIGNILCKKVLMIALALPLFVVPPGFVSDAEAHRCSTRPRHACSRFDCNRAEDRLIEHHERGETQMLTFMRERFHLHREWIMDDYIARFVPQMLMLMAEQMSNVAMFQMEMVGRFFDAELHLQAQRLMQELQAEAARDYQPSDSFCYFGTNVRSLAHSESLAIAAQSTMNQIGFNRSLANVNSSTASSAARQDAKVRWEMFITTYCDPHDNNWRGATSGMVGACGAGAGDIARRNIDVDYTRLVEEPRYLQIDFSDNVVTPDEQDIIALSNNLYAHNSPRSSIETIARAPAQELYMDLRSVMAKRGVAQNSFNAIVGMKSRGSGGGDSAPYFRSLMQDLGMDADDINDIFGDNPSYYAQLEALGKKMFQNTDFFTDLHDSPANVKRKQAALNAIELMLDRAIFESEGRHEMLMSVLLSSYLDKERATEFQNFSQAGANQ